MQRAARKETAMRIAGAKGRKPSAEGIAANDDDLLLERRGLEDP